MMITQFPMFFFNCFSGGVWIFGPFMCELYACTGSIFGLCSICTMAAISYDRYNVIVHGMKGTPMTYGKLFSPIFLYSFQKTKIKFGKLQAELLL
jgi:r-opsin